MTWLLLASFSVELSRMSVLVAGKMPSPRKPFYSITLHLFIFCGPREAVLLKM
jgi:hypothetical protein